MEARELVRPASGSLKRGVPDGSRRPAQSPRNVVKSYDGLALEAQARKGG